MKQQIISLLEGKKKEILKTPFFKTPQQDKQDESFNKGIDTAIESVDEIIEIVKNNL